jgi:hypothetical protein
VDGHGGGGSGSPHGEALRGSKSVPVEAIRSYLAPISRFTATLIYNLFLDDGRGGASRGGVVLVATGSFNPPTYMHLRMFGKASTFAT